MRQRADEKQKTDASPWVPLLLCSIRFFFFFEVSDVCVLYFLMLSSFFFDSRLCVAVCCALVPLLCVCVSFFFFLPFLLTLLALRVVALFYVGPRSSSTVALHGPTLLPIPLCCATPVFGSLFLLFCSTDSSRAYPLFPLRTVRTQSRSTDKRREEVGRDTPTPAIVVGLGVTSQPFARVFFLCG